MWNGNRKRCFFFIEHAQQISCFEEHSKSISSPSKSLCKTNCRHTKLKSLSRINQYNLFINVLYWKHSILRQKVIKDVSKSINDGFLNQCLVSFVRFMSAFFSIFRKYRHYTRPLKTCFLHDKICKCPSSRVWNIILRYCCSKWIISTSVVFNS